MTRPVTEQTRTSFIVAISQRGDQALLRNTRVRGKFHPRPAPPRRADPHVRGRALQTVSDRLDLHGAQRRPRGALLTAFHMLRRPAHLDGATSAITPGSPTLEQVPTRRPGTEQHERAEEQQQEQKHRRIASARRGALRADRCAPQFRVRAGRGAGGERRAGRARRRGADRGAGSDLAAQGHARCQGS